MERTNAAMATSQQRIGFPQRNPYAMDVMERFGPNILFFLLSIFLLILYFFFFFFLFFFRMMKKAHDKEVT